MVESPHLSRPNTGQLLRLEILSMNLVKRSSALFTVGLIAVALTAPAQGQC
jgi:hypothetical protein